MTRVPFAVGLGALLSIAAWAQQDTPPALTLVESVPLETSLDHHTIPNTPDVWLEMIAGADRTLDIEQFYIATEPGEALEPILAAIVEAASRGVEVRVIGDAKFYKTYPEPLDSLDGYANIDVCILDFSQVAGGVQHAKFFIVDDDDAYVGSANFDWRALSHIQELGLRIREPRTVETISDLFEYDWLMCQTKEPELLVGTLPDKTYDTPYLAEAFGETVEITPLWAPGPASPSEALWDLPAIVSAIDGASHEIDIQLLSYTPLVRGGGYWADLDVALRAAAERGVQVRMIVADWGKKSPKLDHLKSLNAVPGIELRFSVIPEHSSGFIAFARVTHAKFMTVDGQWSWIGTSNWDQGYFHDSRGVGLGIRSPALANQLQAVFLHTWDSGYTEVIDCAQDYEPRRVGP